MKEQLEFCKVCKNKQPDFQKGLLCRLTGKRPYFSDKCHNFILDKEESDRRLILKMEAAGDVQTPEGSSPKSNIRVGIILTVIGLLITIGTIINPVGYVSVITYGLIIYGIFRIIKGVRQKQILAEHSEFEKKIE